MAVVPVRFRRPDRLRPDQGAGVREVVVDAWRRAPASPAVDDWFSRALDDLDGVTAVPVERGFVMAFMDFVEAVSDHLASKSARPLVAVRLWLRCIGRLDEKTNEIVATREELAVSLAVSARDVSRVMAELVRIDAVRREVDRAGKARGARVARYFLNERVANHFAEGKREAAMARAPHLKLVDGGLPPTEQRSRAPVSLLPVF